MTPVYARVGASLRGSTYPPEALLPILIRVRRFVNIALTTVGSHFDEEAALRCHVASYTRLVIKHRHYPNHLGCQID